MIKEFLKYNFDLKFVEVNIEKFFEKFKTFIKLPIM